MGRVVAEGGREGLWMGLCTMSWSLQGEAPEVGHRGAKRVGNYHLNVDTMFATSTPIMLNIVSVSPFLTSVSSLQSDLNHRGGPPTPTSGPRAHRWLRMDSISFDVN